MFPAEQFMQVARLRAERPALRCQGVAWSYDELERRSRSLAEQLAELGVGPGERVGIDLGNSAAAVAAIWAVLRLGAAFACLDPTTPAGGWASLIEDFSPRVVLTRRARLHGIRTLPRSRTLVEDRPGPDPGSEIGRFDLERPSDARPLHCGETPETAPANLVYTSGSTGRPKAVVMSHAGVYWAARTISGYLGLAPTDVVLNVLPLSFDYGLYQVLLCGFSGACLVLEPRFGYPGHLLERLRTQRVTTVPGVPSLFQMLLQRSSFEGGHLPTLRRFTNTGSHLPLAVVRGLRKCFPAAELYLMYGLTECKRVSYLPPDEVDAHPDSVGRPMPGCEVAIVDEGGVELGPNRVGQLVVRSRSCMLGYWQREAETDQVLRPGPWGDDPCLWTGDLFFRDGSGLLYFVGRVDDVFKSRGEKVAPVEVERVLCLHEAITQAAVVSAPDPVLGARIHAYVVSNERPAPTERSLKHHCADHLEPFKVPHHITIVDTLPTTARGKIDRAVLASLAAGHASAHSSGGD